MAKPTFDLQASNEVYLQVPILRGLVDSTQTLSYASRLAALLKVRRDLAMASTEAACDRAVQWTVLQEPCCLIIAGCRSRTWDVYLREFANTPDPVLDVIFSHCQTYNTGAGGEVSGWTEQYRCSYQVPFSTAHDVSESSGAFRAPLAAAPHTLVVIERAIRALFQLRSVFSTTACFAGRSEQEMFDGAASALLRHDREAVTAANSMRVLSLGLLRSEQAASDSIATRAAFQELQRLHDWTVSLCELPASTRPGRPIRGDTEGALDESCAAAMRGERSIRSLLALERENASGNAASGCAACRVVRHCSFDVRAQPSKAGTKCDRRRPDHIGRIGSLQRLDRLIS